MIHEFSIFQCMMWHALFFGNVHLQFLQRLLNSYFVCITLLAAIKKKLKNDNTVLLRPLCKDKLFHLKQTTGLKEISHKEAICRLNMGELLVKPSAQTCFLPHWSSAARHLLCGFVATFIGPSFLSCILCSICCFSTRCSPPPLTNKSQLTANFCWPCLQIRHILTTAITQRQRQLEL